MNIILKKLGSTLLLASLFAGMAVGQIISQYIETNDGTTPKGIEIWNNTVATLDFSTNNLIIQKGTNGATPATDYTLSTGTLASGSVIVIGTSDMQTITESNGAVYYLKAFTFNGDDALVVKYGATITDIFGTSGVDPGSAWTGNDVSTANQNIKLLSDITTGDLDGWTDPSLRFEVVSIDPVNDMSDFGLAPSTTSSAPDDPTSLSATTVSASQIDLSWAQNANTDNVMIVYNTDGVFTDPVDGTSYSVSSSALGGTVIYNQSGTSFSHTSLGTGTQYYYKAWSVDGSDNYSTGITDDATTIKSEPTNHVLSFTSTSDDNSITLTWADNDGTSAADGFLINSNSTSLESIVSPEDGTETPHNPVRGNVVVARGVETYTWSGLSAETTYYFKIFPYSNSGSNIDYKTDGTVPNQSKSTTTAPATPKVFISEMCDPTSDYAVNRFIEIYNAGDESVDLSGWKVEAIVNDGSIVAFTWNLSGSIVSGDALVCGDDGNTLITPDFAEAGWSSGSTSWNGKLGDGAKLYNGTTLIDNAGSHGNFENKTTQRIASVTSPTTTFSSAEWTSASTANYENATPGTHTCDEPSGSSAPDVPGSFTATTVSASQINLSWTLNGNSDNVMIVFDEDGSFTNPVNGTSYTVSSSALGGTVIYSGSAISYNHTGLSAGTQYYYKAWSVDGSDNYSIAVSDDETTVKAEPSNQVTDFAATSSSSRVTLSWTDNNGAIAADGFLIKASTNPRDDIENPVDGTVVSNDTDLSDGSAAVNVGSGIGTYAWTGLSSSSTYYFKIYPYSNSETNINYKIDGDIPFVSGTTSAPIKVIITEIMINPDSTSDQNGEWIELYNAGTETVNIDGWTLSDNGVDAHTISNGGTLNIAVGEYIVLGTDSDTTTNGGYPCDYEYGSFLLANADDEIIIKDGTSVIDSIAYNAAASWTLPVGASIVFTGTVDEDNNLYSNWGISALRLDNFSGITGDKGSPGTSSVIDCILNIKLFLDGSLGQ